MVTQREIERAYLEGWDVLALDRRRRTMLAVAIVCAAFPLAYALKCALGIDLFEFHLKDLL